MTGIYQIKNLINNKIYIGQSVDINRRWQEHLRSGQPDKYSMKNERDSKAPIHLAMQKYGITNFSLTILEECSKEELNSKEKYWISYYNSNNKNYGYNITPGGQDDFALKGELHSQAKLTQKDVNKIKKLLKENELTMTEIVNIFPIISKPTVSMINQGKIWKDDNESYPLRPTYYGNKGSANPKAKYTEEKVLEMREKFKNGVSKKEIIDEYASIASEQSVRNILKGKTYKHLL